MVVKAIINAIGKAKPKKFPDGSKFKRDQVDTLLEETQSKVEKIDAGKLKLDRKKIIPLSEDDFFVRTSDVSPTLAPDVVKTNTVRPPKPSSKKAVDEFMSEEQEILAAAKLRGDEDTFLNFNKINSSDDIKISIEKLGSQYAKKIKERTGGVQTVKETKALADLLGSEPETLAGNLLKLRPGSPLNAAEITAAKNLLVSQHKKLTGLAKQLQTETGDNTKTALEFARQHALTAELTKVYKGAQTEIARALNILKEPVQEGKVINLKLDQLNRNNILMNYGGAKTAKKVAELYLETPGLIKKINFAEKSFLSKSSDALVEVFLNNILSGTLTHVKNIGGNWIYKALERAERVYAARMYGGKSIDSVAEFEDVAQAFGEHIVTSNMIKAFNSKLFTINTLKNPLKNFPGFESKISGTKFESPVHAFSAQEFGINEKSIYGKFFDVAGRILTFDRIPYKVLQGADNYFKNAAYYSEIYALAFRETLKQVKTGNLPMNKASDAMAALITDPPESFTTAAYDTALKRTFQTPLSKGNNIVSDVAEGIQKIKKSKGFNPLTIFSSQYFTFMRTPTNIATAALERMPIANRIILKSYREELSAGGARAEMAKAKAALGWGFMSTFGLLGYYGVFSGGDIDVRGRKNYQLKKAANKQPKSFRFENILSDEVQELTGLTGSKIQLSINGFEPAVLLASVAADLGATMANIQDDWQGWNEIEDKVLQFFGAYAISFGENMVNTTFMNGAGRLMDLIQNVKYANDKTIPLQNEAKRIVSGLVPYTTFLAQFEDLGSDEIETEGYKISNKDDFRKLNIEFKSMVQKFIPGFENDLYVDRDWLGDPVPKFSVISSMSENPINKVAAELNYQPIPLRKSKRITVYDLKGKDGQSMPLGAPMTVTVRLTEKEYAFLNYYQGTAIKAYLNDFIKNDKEFNSTNDKQYKLSLFEDEVSFAKEDAFEDFKEERPEMFAEIEARAEKIAAKQWLKQNR